MKTRLLYTDSGTSIFSCTLCRKREISESTMPFFLSDLRNTERNQMVYHLAQVNIARMLAPLTDPLMAGFVADLDAINALADTSPGFLWRLQTSEGNATDIRPYEDDLILVNLSLWASLSDLSTFVFKS